MYFGAVLACPALFLDSKGWIGHGLAFAIITFGIFLIVDAIIWERAFGFRSPDGPVAEQRLPHSFGWAMRRYIAAIVFTGVVIAIQYFYGRDSWQMAAAVIAFPIIYVSLLVVGVLQAMLAVDGRIG